MIYTKTETEKLKELNTKGMGPKEIAEYFPNRTFAGVKSKLVMMGLTINPTDNSTGNPIDNQSDFSSDEDKIIKAIKQDNRLTVIELADRFNMSPRNVNEVVGSLHDKGYNLCVVEGEQPYINLRRETRPSEPVTIDVEEFFGKEIKFGAIADTHIGSKYERMDVLDALYDVFEREHVKTVFHGGNYVDGEFYFNKYETYTHGFDEMIDNFIEKYPQRKGMKTFFISGDDHEGWWMQREGMDAGRVIIDRARSKGRKDLVYLGYQEADIILKNKKGSALLRLMHAGGGTAYADSYATQKMVESFQEGNKPNILLVGHYHKSVYHTPRGIHVVQLGTTQDQTRFMRKKKLRAHLGGWLITMNQADTGEINRFQPEWLHFYNEGFYRSKIGESMYSLEEKV